MPDESATTRDGKVERSGSSNVTPFSGKGYTTGEKDGSKPGRVFASNSRVRAALEKEKEFKAFSGTGNRLGDK